MNSNTATDAEPGDVTPCTLQLHDASLVLPASLSQRWLADIQTVGIVIAEGHLQLYPVHDAAQGGRLLKMRNRQGDRVVHIGDLLCDQQLSASGHWLIPASWNAAQGMLTAHLDDWQASPEPKHEQ